LGGIAGLDARETDVEDPEALEATRRLTLAWLASALSVERDAWANAHVALRDQASALAVIAVKKRRNDLLPFS
jgi:hypothetical protein